VVDQSDKVVQEVSSSKLLPRIFERLADLHDIARRSAQHTDQDLSDLLASLEQIR
jgi:hypothetical protein